MPAKNFRFIYFVFFLTGISGLIYQTVWLRVLSRILGSTVEASSITISAFMLGLSLGSFFIGKYCQGKVNRFRLYALLELGIAASAFIIFFLFGQLAPLYKSVFELVNGNIFIFRILQAILLFILLLIPTFLMGGTLPVLSSAMLSHEQAFTRLIGYLYGLNTLGAMAGVILGGFFILGSWGETNTVLTGVFFNVLAGLAVLIFSKKPGPMIKAPKIFAKKSTAGQETAFSFPESTRKFIVIAYAVAGFCSLALEVVWIRVFQLPLGTAIYAFSAVLIVYLGGSALGSYVFGKYFSRLSTLPSTAGLAIVFTGLWGILGLYFFKLSDPWQINPDMIFNLSAVFIPFLIVFPVTFLLGFIFPLITKIYVASQQETAIKIGRLYSLNTFGCILGSLAAGYIFIPFFGTRCTVIIVSCINIILGFILLSHEKKILQLFSLNMLRLACIAITVIMIAGSGDPYLAVVKKFIASSREMEYEIKHHKETATATVTALVSAKYPLGKYLMINGVGVTSLCNETKLMAHLPLLLHRNPREMLIVCYGMGTCLRSAASHKDLTIDQVELVDEEYKINSIYHADAGEILGDKRVHAYVDDGRNYLLMHSKKYDVISIDPAPPIWSAGTVNLYTYEFFRLCRDHLKEDGVFCIWIPPGASTDLKMIMKSFQHVFPENTVYRGISYTGFYMIGYPKYFPPDINRFNAAAADKRLMADLFEWGKIFMTPADMLQLKIMNAEQLKEFLKDVKEVSDNYPYTEFPLWRKIYDPEYLRVLDARTILPGARPSHDDYINLGLKLFDEQKFEECIDACRQAIRIEPASYVAYTNMATAYNFMGKWENAIRACEVALTFNPDYKQAQNNLALAKEQIQKIITR